MNELDPAIVDEALARVSGIANRTPVMTSRTLNSIVGSEVFLKCENFQRGGAFKFRGAYNAICQLSDRQKRAGIITHSSGNHAQGVALAAKLLNIPATIVMPEDAPTIKRKATKEYGANIVICEAIDREQVTEELINRNGYTLIHPYDNAQIIAGQGTAALELINEIGRIDYLYVPVGGGGLISGSALAAARHSPECQVIGVEPEAAADACRSWREGKIHWLSEVPSTIADGLRPLHVGERNFIIMRRYVSDMVTVTESEIVDAFRFIWERLKLIVEPSSAVALAPLLNQAIQPNNKRIGVIISGGNLDVNNPIFSLLRSDL